MGAAPRQEALPAWEALRRYTDELGAARGLDEALSSVATWVRAEVDRRAVVGLARPDPAGRLRVVWKNGPLPRSRPKRFTQRRNVFVTGISARCEVAGPPRSTIGLFPLVGGGGTLGVLEVGARRTLDEVDWVTLELIASHLGLTLGGLMQAAELRRDIEALQHASSLVNDLLRARTSGQAIQVSARLVAERFRTAVAGWSRGPNGRMELTCIRGLGGSRRHELRAALPCFPPARSGPERDRARRRFCEIVGVADATLIDAGDGVLVIGESAENASAQLDVVGALLTEVLRLLEGATLAERRNEQLDLGLAWTAHELRGPLLGVRAVMDLLLRHEDGDGRDRAILRSSLRELDRVVDTAEGILAWSVGARQLRRRPADVVRVVKDAVRSCRQETGEDGVVVLAPPRAVATIDAEQLRSAVANLVRNAVAYSDPGTSVQVSVEEDGNRILLSVEDEGPSIPPYEQTRIFDPFSRGSTSDGRANGSGLGLFIARRVVEAHGGSIWVESGQHGTAFRVMLPAGGRQRRIAS